MPPEVADYIRNVKSGVIIAGREQKQLCRLVEKAFRKENLRYDPEQIKKYLSYQKYFPYKLFSWEVFLFILHVCVFRSDGRPRWPDLFVLVGRGAGKNGFLSFEDFCLLTETHGVREYDIDICATSEEQAKTSFDEIYDVLENPLLRDKMKKNFRWNRTEIRNLRTNSVLKYRTNNAKGKDGLRSGMVCFDEVHAYENWDNINVFTTGLGKKAHPRRVYITSDGDVRDGPLDQLKAQAEAILSGKQDDGGMLPFICRLEKDSDVHKEEKWPMANPSLIYFPDLMDQMRREYVQYAADPVTNSAFMTKRMCRPAGKKDTEVTSWDNIVRASRPQASFFGATCVAGIDYTKTTDFLSAGILQRVGDEFHYFQHSWFCTKSNDAARIKLPLHEMEHLGLLTIVDDAEISPWLPAQWLAAQQEQLGLYIQTVGIDSYRWTLLSRELKQAGFDPEAGRVKLTRPSDIMRVQPQIASLFIRGGIAWGDDPMMRWYTNNAKLEPGPNGNYKYGKIEEKSRKTDGFMAFVAAMCVAEQIPEESGELMEAFTF